MIRSIDRPVSPEWKRVPPGFHVVWPDGAIGRRLTQPPARRSRVQWRDLCTTSLGYDLLRIVGAAMRWRVLDALRAPPRHRHIVLRLPGTHRRAGTHRATA